MEVSPAGGMASRQQEESALCELSIAESDLFVDVLLTASPGADSFLVTGILMRAHFTFQFADSGEAPKCWPSVPQAREAWPIVLWAPEAWPSVPQAYEARSSIPHHGARVLGQCAAVVRGLVPRATSARVLAKRATSARGVAH